jgi:hypothetical protein
MHLLRECLDAELSEPLAVSRDREAQQCVQVREALGRLVLEDDAPEEFDRVAVPKDMVGDPEKDLGAK